MRLGHVLAYSRWLGLGLTVYRGFGGAVSPLSRSRGGDFLRNCPNLKVKLPLVAGFRVLGVIALGPVTFSFVRTEDLSQVLGLPS